MKTAPRFAIIAKVLVRSALWFWAANLLAAVLAAQCTNVSQVPNQTISSGTICYSNNDTLTAAGVTINGSASVTFVAGHTVHLTPGFRATAGTAGTTFHAWVETAPSVISVSPSSGSGLSQQFAWTVSSPSGYGNLAQVYALFNTSVSGVNACYIYYSRGANALFLADNSGTVWTGGFGPGSAGSASNSQCTIYGSGSSVSSSGNQLSLTVNVAFQSSFAGTKNNYLNAYDNAGLYTGWQQMGAWTVSAAQQYFLTTTVSPVGAGTIAPASGWYNAGQVVQVGAAPNSGYQFASFSGVDSSNGSSGSVTMNANRSVTANFAPLSSPLLSITSAHSGNFVQAQTASYTLTVSNAVGAGATLGTVTVTDTLPGGLALSSMSGNGWICVTSTCSRSDTLPAGASYPAITVTVNVAWNATSPQVNQATVSGGGSPSGSASDPAVTERVTANLTDFQSCIGSTGTAGVCRLIAGRYSVVSTLRIQRSNLVVTGGGGPADTTLVRGATSVTWMMYADSPATDVTITNFTFDGNRYGFGAGRDGEISCLGLDRSASYWDLDLTNGGRFIVEFVNFMNAPDTALVLAGVGSSVSFSNFGSGGYGVGPDGNLRIESAAETATRATAIWLDGGGSGAWYNRIQYAGTAAINLVGSGQYAYGNSLFQNRYELSDVSHDPLVCGSTGVPCVQQGGQLTVWTTSSNASVAGNVIDGNNWPAEDGTPGKLPASANGCPFGNGSAFNPGVEAYGTGHYFYNNEVVNNTGSGMQLAGASDTNTRDITISSWNPWEGSDTPRYIEHNHVAGIVFLGPVTNPSFTKPAIGVTLDNVLVRNNAAVGVYLDSVTPDFVTNPNIGGQYTGFANYGCLISNTEGDTIAPGTTLPTPTPTPPNQYRNGPPGGGVMTACPATPWPQLPPPARSHDPRWSW